MTSWNDPPAGPPPAHQPPGSATVTTDANGAQNEQLRSPDHPADPDQPPKGRPASPAARSGGAAHRTGSRDSLDELLARQPPRRDSREGYMQQRWSAEHQAVTKRRLNIATSGLDTGGAAGAPEHALRGAGPACRAGGTVPPASEPPGSPASPATPSAGRSSRLWSAISRVKDFASRSMPDLLGLAGLQEEQEDDKVPLLDNSEAKRGASTDTLPETQTGPAEQGFGRRRSSSLIL